MIIAPPGLGWLCHPYDGGADVIARYKGGAGQVDTATSSLFRGHMAEYHFVSRWQIQAPIEQVWDEIYHAERWPSWWKYVVSVEELEPGAGDGAGARFRLLFRTRLPYALGFDVCLTNVQPPQKLEAEATGELRGTGRWTLTSAEGGTLVRYDSDIATTRWWMNLLAPLARPAFQWNHGELMREGGQSLARRLSADLVLPDTTSRPHRPVQAAPWIALGAALAAFGVLGWRRRNCVTSGHDAAAWRDHSCWLAPAISVTRSGCLRRPAHRRAARAALRPAGVQCASPRAPRRARRRPRASN